MIRKAALAAAVASTLLFGGAWPASGEISVQRELAFLGRGDPRLCPSPLCGGIWVRGVNRAAPLCPDPVGRQCYVASTTIDELPVPEGRRARLAALFGQGRALAFGRIVYGQVDGFPHLGILRVSQVWQAWGSTSGPAGVFRLLRDNGVRCVTTPCFSIGARALNHDREIAVSTVDLTGTGVPPARRARALAQIGTRGLVVSGRIARNPDAGPAGDGRVLVATRLYVRAYP